MRPGRTVSDAQRLAELEHEVRKLRRANHIFKTASAFFAAKLERPTRGLSPTSTPIATMWSMGARSGKADLSRNQARRRHDRPE